MTRITTLTLHPALDVSLSVKRVEPEAKLRCERPRRDPGGGGINVSRVIAEFGGETAAVFAAGGHTGDELTSLVSGLAIEFRRIQIEAATRENITVSEEETGNQFRFTMPGAPLTRSECREAARVLAEDETDTAMLVISGSLPPQVGPDVYTTLIHEAMERSVRVVVDTSGDALRAAASAGAFMLKPNRRELGTLLGRRIASDEDAADAAAELIRSRAAEVVVVSLGDRGACLVTESGRWFARNPDVQVVSAIGAGDSMVAALSLAFARGSEPSEALRRGVAAGAAAVITPGTELVRRDDYERLLGQIHSSEHAA